MSGPTDPQWHFFGVPKEGGGSSDLHKVVRGGGFTEAELIAREVVQNSVDAGRKLRENFLRGTPDGKLVKFSMNFRFDTLVGDRKRGVVSALQLLELKQHQEESPDAINFDAGQVLEELDNDESPLRVVYISDYGAHGLYGQPQQLTTDSVLFNALYYMGNTSKGDDTVSGGSFGFGKSAFIRGSRFRSVFAYSCFRPYAGQPNELDPVTRRAVGFTWWASHKSGHDQFDGRAHLASLSDGCTEAKDAEPLEDELADTLAEAAGMRPRDHRDVNQLGTTLMLLEPTFTAKDLSSAIKKSWWPALVEGELDVSVTDETGGAWDISPENDPELVPFIRAYKIATGAVGSIDGGSERDLSARFEATRDLKKILGTSGGSMAAVAVEKSVLLGNGDADNYSFSPKLATPLSQSQVALMRSPLMIVKYLPARSPSHGAISLKGVFVASDAADPYLRETEPPLHDEWDGTQVEDATADRSRAIARSVFNRIAAAMGEFARDVAPPPQVNSDGLPHFSNLISKFFKAKSSSRGGVDRNPALLSIEYSETAAPRIVSGRVVVSARVKIGLRKKATDPSYRIAVKGEYVINEEESASTRGLKIPVHLTPDTSTKSSERIGVEWIGDIAQGEFVNLLVSTDPYDPQWTGSLVVSAEIIGDGE